MKGFVHTICTVLSLACAVSLAPSTAAADSLDAAAGELEPSTWAESEFNSICGNVVLTSGQRIVCADLVALEQTLVYNRFGSFNPFGMIFALRRDVVPSAGSGRQLTSEYCGGRFGTEHHNGQLEPGDVRLKDCKRPRPVVLRANVGDLLLLRVENLLADPEPPDFSRDFCHSDETSDEGRRRVRIGVREGDSLQVTHGEADCTPKRRYDKVEAVAEVPDWPRTRLVNLVAQGLTPMPMPDARGETVHGACRGVDAVKPGESFLCLYSVDQEGTYFFASPAAPAGGEGDGGSIVHGLFGAVVAEKQGSRWYRSQVSQAALDAAWPRPVEPLPKEECRPSNETARQTGNEPAQQPRLTSDRVHVRLGTLDYEAVDNCGTPILNMARTIDAPQSDFDSARRLELVHADLNAIIWCNAALGDAADCRADTDGSPITVEPAYHAFREFSVFFHDELKTFYTRNFRELARLGQLAGVRDGFAINYGASGMGAMLLANRKRIGPAADCMECLYEEFFLTSWANGDPALLEWYADDPSNVHHSYLNAPVVFRNFHAGPKETHVFHLHAHQWFAGNDPNRGSYLDSQTVGPQQGFTYNIYHGGLRDKNGAGKGWWDTQGSGNRNRTLGDSIFHCHLYPHFAQGMWALWRVHDVFEDGTRRLPDGQSHDGLSLYLPKPATGEAKAEEVGPKRTGSVNPETGAWLEPDAETGQGLGTPIPALVPLPGEPLPLLPTYADSAVSDGSGAGTVVAESAGAPMPGYPFYIAGRPGHRPPQAPLDIARNIGANPGGTVPDGIDARMPAASAEDEWLSAGLGRHRVADGAVRKLGFEVPDFDADGATGDALELRHSLYFSQVIAKAFALGDLSGHLETAELERLSPWGETLERAAMGFHFNGSLYTENGGSGPALKLAAVDGTRITGQSGRGAYPTRAAPLPGSGQGPLAAAEFRVNGSAPKPGAPFADPCGVARSPDQGREVSDPLGRGWLDKEDFLPDPDLKGYRRYEASAVQLDMVVNGAGWHDPQARINVLTAFSDNYKNGPRWRISPYVSDREEPFFFRALSGECIEFRHTNELPKELELDDFQVRTPTDTIGQHIHLVKFDVTSSDGSGNGWNYEDGTFAPDEIASRLCAENKSEVLGPLWKRVRAAMTPEQQTIYPEGTGFCGWSVVVDHDIWRLERSQFPFLFQTTTQRWFADPILSDDGQQLPKPAQQTAGANTASGNNNEIDPVPVDRTMRTVFTHDHFGPSSIQQHGFYSALVVEPPVRKTQGADGAVATWFPKILPPKLTNENDPTAAGNQDYSPLPLPFRREAVAWGSSPWVGTHKRILVAGNQGAAKVDPAYFEHPNYREYALSIADFALLYDPRDRESPMLDAVANASRTIAGGLDGMAKLYCEAYWRFSPSRLGTVCGTPAERRSGTTSYFYPEEVPPAWLAAGAFRDDAHRRNYSGDLFTPDNASLQPDKPEVVALGNHLWSYRLRAAGRNPDTPRLHDGKLAKPVNAPARPEAISVDHHDPYLVSYRGAPMPLRIGTKNPDGSPSSDCELKRMARPGAEKPGEAAEAVAAGAFGECSVAYQKAQERGDMGLAFSSRRHGDPETPLLEAYQGERIVMRMVQGAQEVQHMFGVAGQPFKRNIDQAWPRGMQPLGQSGTRDADPTLQSACFGRPIIDRSRPREYRTWLDTAPGWTDGRPKGWEDAGVDADHWLRFESALAECDNIEGFTYAQEIGISEHFEMQGTLRADVNTSFEVLPTRVQSNLALTEGGVPVKSSDYFYSFGTVDALWNGAWGLMRIYQNKDTLDPATIDFAAPDPTAGATKIGARLDAVTMFSSRLEAAIRPEDYRSTSGMACPQPLEGQSQRVVDAAVVAVEMRRAFPNQKGTIYGDQLYDPDGLFLALMSPAQLGLSDIEDEGFKTLTAKDTLDAIARAYPAQPEPFVLRVRAGDCLRLRVVNLLGETTTGARDVFGDALLPRIVPLNSDPPAQVGREPVAPGSSRETTVGRLDRPKGRPEGVRPSARLALTFGLPGLDLIRTVPSGYGFNADPLPGGHGGARVSDVLMAYAGRFRLDLPGDANDVGKILEPLIERGVAERLVAAPGGGEFLTQLQSRLAAALAASEPGDAIREILFVQDDNSQMPFGQYLSTPITLQFGDTLAPLPVGLDAEGCGGDGCDDDIETLNEALKEILASAVAEALDKRTHWIPYAFGAVPVRPVADPVSQGPHGLFGAIDVVPANWAPTDNDGIDCDPVDLRGYIRCGAGYVAGAPFGHGFRWMATGEDGKTQQLREFVLFWQDGMNHWDDRSPLAWSWSGEPKGRSLGNMVPDCLVCDDSYDLGEAGFSYQAPSFSRMLRERLATSLGYGGTIHRSDDLNAYAFPADFFTKASEAPRLVAKSGEEVVIRVLHPGGRARQRTFTMNGYTYDDLFPGFGFPRSALLAPGKAISAWLRPDAGVGPVLWHDGPTFLRAAGTWGLLDVEPAE